MQGPQQKRLAENLDGLDRDGTLERHGQRNLFETQISVVRRVEGHHHAVPFVVRAQQRRVGLRIGVAGKADQPALARLLRRFEGLQRAARAEDRVDVTLVPYVVRFGVLVVRKTC